MHDPCSSVFFLRTTLFQPRCRSLPRPLAAPVQLAWPHRNDIRYATHTAESDYSCSIGVKVARWWRRGRMTVREQTFGARVLSFAGSFDAAVQTLLCSDDCRAAQSLTHFCLAFSSVSHGPFASISCIASRPRCIGMFLFFLLCLSFRVPAPTAPETEQRAGWIGTNATSPRRRRTQPSCGFSERSDGRVILVLWF